MIPAWSALPCLVLVVSYYSVKVISEPDRCMRWKLLFWKELKTFQAISAWLFLEKLDKLI